MKRFLAAALFAAVFLAITLIPGVSYTEDMETVLLARTLYTAASDKSDIVMMDVGSVIMNRVDSVWFPDEITEVLDAQHQFARGTRYDERSIGMARRLMAGERTLPTEAVYYDLNAFGNGVGELIAGDESFGYYAQK